MIDWKQKLKNQWVQIEISRVQPGKPGKFLRLVSFSFEYSSDCPIDCGQYFQCFQSTAQFSAASTSHIVLCFGCARSRATLLVAFQWNSSWNLTLTTILYSNIHCAYIYIYIQCFHSSAPLTAASTSSASRVLPQWVLSVLPRLPIFPHWLLPVVHSEEVLAVSWPGHGAQLSGRYCYTKLHPIGHSWYIYNLVIFQIPC